MRYENGLIGAFLTVLVAADSFISTAQAGTLDFDFTMTDTCTGPQCIVGGVVTGEVEGLSVGFPVSASEVIITSYPAALNPGSPAFPSPYVITATNANEFNVAVVGGIDTITLADYFDTVGQLALSSNGLGGGYLQQSSGCTSINTWSPGRWSILWLRPWPHRSPPPFLFSPRDSARWVYLVGAGSGRTLLLWQPSDSDIRSNASLDFLETAARGGLSPCFAPDQICRQFSAIQCFFKRSFAIIHYSPRICPCRITATVRVMLGLGDGAGIGAEIIASYA